ncbi:MAG: 30S ribosomal protein S20 [Parachlamydiales bacterium]|nr:30S ribosomal protein S20 [Parachlamydiales bacterium]
MAEEDKKKIKRPTAVKRDIQNAKRNLRNRSCKAQIKTAIRSVNTACADKQTPAEIQKKINLAYSLIDKAVKKHLFKKNKAAREKSHLSDFMKKALNA